MKKNDETEEKIVLAAGNSMRVQRDQLYRAEEQMGQMQDTLTELTQQGAAQDQALAEIMALMDAEDSGVDVTRQYLDLASFSPTEIQTNIQMTKVIPLTQEDSWEEYLGSVDWYARLEHMDLSTDPYTSLLSKKEQEDFVKQVREDYYERKAQCDAMDYALAAFCGTVAGLVDIFFVGTPGNSVLGQWTDKQTNNMILFVAQKLGWSPQQGNEGRIDLAIAFLERKFWVNYDFENSDRIGEAAKGYLNMTNSNHHIKNLAHSPDLGIV